VPSPLHVRCVCAISTRSATCRPSSTTQSEPLSTSGCGTWDGLAQHSEQPELLHVLLSKLPRPKFSHITRSLYWLKITERIEYKLLSLTYFSQPPNLHIKNNLITVQPPHSTRSSSLVTLARPSTSSSLRITDNSFQYASLVSGINSWLLSVNHALISPILTHPASSFSDIPQSVPSTHHSHHPSPFHCFVLGLKPSFSANVFQNSISYRIVSLQD